MCRAENAGLECPLPFIWCSQLQLGKLKARYLADIKVHPLASMEQCQFTPVKRMVLRVMDAALVNHSGITMHIL